MPDNLPLITENTWQLCLENRKQFTSAVNYAVGRGVPTSPILLSEDEDWQLEFWSDGLWASLEKDPALQQVTLMQFKAMCDAYKA